MMVLKLLGHCTVTINNRTTTSALWCNWCTGSWKVWKEEEMAMIIAKTSYYSMLVGAKRWKGGGGGGGGSSSSRSRKTIGRVVLLSVYANNSHSLVTINLIVYSRIFCPWSNECVYCSRELLRSGTSKHLKKKKLQLNILRFYAYMAHVHSQ